MTITKKKKNNKGVSGELVPPKKYGKGSNLGFAHATIMLQLFLGKTKKKGSNGITARDMNLEFHTAIYIYTHNTSCHQKN
jgi:hypothetical protein